MNLKNKNVLVIGLGITGVSAIKALDKLGANIWLYDSKNRVELKTFLDDIKTIDLEEYLAGDYPDLDKIDLIIKSPGVPPYIEILLEAEIKGIETITDIELYYRLKSGKNMIAITGTNGKTTTTKLLGEIFNKAGRKAYTVGNIGIGILDSLFHIQEEDILIIEASSFQLEDTIDFKAHISAIINITPDHIDWHGGFDNYIDAKRKIIENQDADDYSILNYDDLIVREIGENANTNVIWFSVESSLEEGAFLQEDWIVFKKNKIIKKIIKKEDIQIPGKHNLENILAALSIGLTMGLKADRIASALRDFKGVEHRVEYVKTKDQRAFYNDSKGTNPDSTINAIKALNSPIILIAGGHDKGSEYDDLIESFEGKVRTLILLGETRDKIKDSAISKGFKHIHLTKTMKEAVELAYKISRPGDNILLSPACASWGMYANFEERGRDFKNIVESL